MTYNDGDCDRDDNEWVLRFVEPDCIRGGIEAAERGDVAGLNDILPDINEGGHEGRE